MLSQKEIADMARNAIKTANMNLSQGSYNSGYEHGFADALKKVGGLKYYAISVDGFSWTWQWLTEEEAEAERKAGHMVRQ